MIEAFSAASLHFDKQFGDKVGLKLKEKSQKWIITSFVFHRCLWLGKWSDFGNDSRLSGNLSGSPSEIKKKEKCYLTTMTIWNEI